MFNKVGKQTPLFTRFSTVAGEKGSADQVRDPRGFAIKFYTEEGIYDMVGNNTPVFFIRDAIKFPDFIHTQKPNPRTGRGDPEAAWDFWSKHPESYHQLVILFSDRGTPYGVRHMHGFSSHTYKWVNAKGEEFFVQYHFRTDAGIKNFSAEEAAETCKKDPTFARKDLYDHIEGGKTASWTFYVQVMPVKDAETFKWDVLDITKVWPKKHYPLHEVGKMVLNRNPENWFAEVEQVAFAPTNLVPGIEATNDKMLQGRLFSYPDTQRHRLGRNYDQIPVNNSYRSKVNVYSRDGQTRVDGNGGSSVNYEPNSRGGVKPDIKYAISPVPIGEKGDRYPMTHSNDDFEQPGILYKRIMNSGEKTRLVENIAGHMGPSSDTIKRRACEVWRKVDKELGDRVAEAVGVSMLEAKL